MRPHQKWKYRLISKHFRANCAAIRWNAEVRFLREYVRSFKSNSIAHISLTSANLVMHIKKHKNIRDFICEYCGKAFCHRDSYRDHVKAHTGVRDYVCDQCPKAFRTLDVLKVHKLSHTDQKPHVCSVCSKAFRQRTGLYYHKRTHVSHVPHRTKIDHRINNVLFFFSLRPEKNRMFVNFAEKPSRKRARWGRMRKANIKYNPIRCIVLNNKMWSQNPCITRMLPAGFHFWWILTENLVWGSFQLILSI